MRILKGAQIVVPVGPSVACVARNISETGARLELQTPILSNTFDLVFDDNEWPSRACRVVWRKETSIGVAFTEPVAAVVEVVAVEAVDVAGGPAGPLLPD